jgi:hypothetical protein
MNSQPASHTSRQLTDYVLPDGTIAPCDASATKNAPWIDFTLNGGRIVTAIRRDLTPLAVQR